MFKKIISGVSLFCFAASMAFASASSKNDKPVIPDDLFFELKNVPATENAIVSWRRAVEARVALGDKENQILKFCWTPAARNPSSDDLDDIKNWLRRNSEALRLFNESLNQPKAQWPERNPQNPQPELLALHHFIRARLFEADQLAEAGKFDEAIKSLQGSLKLAQTGVEADAALIHYMISCRTRTLVQDAILRLGCRKQLPTVSLEKLLNDLPSLDTETNVYARVLRVEFTRDYNTVIDFKKLAEQWSKISETNAAMFLYPDDCRRPLRILLDPSLLPFHPHPLDENAENEKSERHYRIYRTNSFSPWADRNGQVELESEENHTNLLADMAPLIELLKQDSLPLNKQAAQKARALYLKIENPIGRIFDCSISGFIGSDMKVFESRAEREATRTVLALLIFERSKGVLPAKLSDLVEAKILKSIPSDPFSGSEILYFREKRIVWSVGADGIDDEGTAGKFRWAGDDAVWQIPELN